MSMTIHKFLTCFAIGFLLLFQSSCSKEEEKKEKANGKLNTAEIQKNAKPVKVRVVEI